MGTIIFIILVAAACWLLFQEHFQKSKFRDEAQSGQRRFWELKEKSQRDREEAQRRIRSNKRK